MTYSDPPPDPVDPHTHCAACNMRWTTVEEVAVPGHREPWQPGCDCREHQSPLARERFQHEALGRHDYRAWRRTDQKRMQDQTRKREQAQ